MTPDYFCLNCSTKAKGNTSEGVTGDHYMICGDCGMQIRFYISQKPTKTIEEAQTTFNNRPLTDHQKFGRANKGKWAMKKKNG